MEKNIRERSALNIRVNKKGTWGVHTSAKATVHTFMICKITANNSGQGVTSDYKLKIVATTLPICSNKCAVSEVF